MVRIRKNAADTAEIKYRNDLVLIRVALLTGKLQHELDRLESVLDHQKDGDDK